MLRVDAEVPANRRFPKLATELAKRPEGSGITVDVHLYGHFKVRDGKVVYLFEHQDRDAALKAAGLIE